MGFFRNYIKEIVGEVVGDCDLKLDVTGQVFTDKEYELKENKIWYKANKDNLFRFYETCERSTKLHKINDFYRMKPDNLPVQHYPLSDMITKTMVNLVFSEKPEIGMSTGNKKTDKELNKILDKIYDDNNLSDLLQEAAELESYSGAVAFKPVIDPEFSEYPILMAYPKEDIQPVFKYNRLVAVIFKDYYKKDKENYVLFTECGLGYIDYSLYRQKAKNNFVEVKIDTLPETKGLKRIEFKTKDNKPVNKLMAVYKENKTDATSDYSGIIDDFQALDEIYSNMINYIRKSKVLTYMPENMCQKDAKGKTIVPRDYSNDYTILYDSNPDGTKTEAKRDVIDIQNTITGYTNAFNEVLKHAVLTTGLSLSSIGYDISGANASGEALAIREKVSMRTRSEKIHRWDIALRDLSKLLLALYSNKVVGENVFIDNTFDYDVVVSFAEYEAPTFDAIVQSLTAAKDADLIDLSTALHKLWDGEMSEEEIQLMQFNIENKIKESKEMIDNALVDTEEEEKPQEETPEENKENEENIEE